MYPTKSTTTREVIAKLNLQKETFGNPVYIVTDKGTAFTSQEFNDYYKEEQIKSMTITIDLSRANGKESV